MEVAIISTNNRCISSKDVDIDKVMYDDKEMERLISTYLGMLNFSMAYNELPPYDRITVEGTIYIVNLFRATYPERFMMLVSKSVKLAQKVTDIIEEDIKNRRL